MSVPGPASTERILLRSIARAAFLYVQTGANYSQLVRTVTTWHAWRETHEPGPWSETHQPGSGVRDCASEPGDVLSVVGA